jgi:hypothetical protein
MPAARQIGMMPRHMRRGLITAAACGLLGVTLAGCGSVVASSGAPSPGASSSAGGAASIQAGTAGSATSSATASAPLAGCAGVNQATMVTVTRLTHLVPSQPDVTPLVTDRTPAQVRALFRDFCNAVSHPDAQRGLLHCPADFGTAYTGAFYDGTQVLARYTYAASGCGQVGIIVGSTTRSTMLVGPAAAAAPHLAADFAAVLGQAKQRVLPSPTQVNPGGPMQSA